MKFISIVIAVCLLEVPAYANPLDVIPLEESNPAPFTGILVPEARFIQLLEAESELVLLRKEHEVQQRFAASMEKMYKKQLSNAVEPSAWYETPVANRWLGFVLGAVATSLAVWGGIEMVKANK